MTRGGDGSDAGLDRLLDRCDFPLPSDGDVALAVSGGADSLALLVLARRAGLRAVAIHVDHGLRAGSEAEAEVVARTASVYGCGFERRTIRVEPGPDLEARARLARYGALPPGVLTGHTMDDQAETVLLNVLRGAALDGLAPMGGRYGGPRRPLIRLRRRETAALCREEGLVPVVDPTNEDPRFWRNRIRHEALPLLAAIAGRDLVPILARQAELLGDDAALLNELASSLDPTDARALAAAPPPLARRSLRGWLRDPADGEVHPPSAAEVARVLAVAAGRARGCELAGGRQVRRSAGRLDLLPASTGAIEKGVLP